MRREAHFDPTRTYRYALRRIWDPGGTRALFVMLNPSTADGDVDDPTIRRCLGFARRLGCGSLEVANLFAYRTPHPRVLAGATDPVGPANDGALRRALGRAGHVIVAWGNGATDTRFTKELDDRVCAFAEALAQREAHCFGLTQAGHPRHPLRLAGDTPLRRWSPPAALRIVRSGGADERGAESHG